MERHSSHLNTLIEKNKKILKKQLTFAESYTIIISASVEGCKGKESGCGSAWLERLVWDQEVAGSNPVTPTETLAGVVQW